MSREETDNRRARVSPWIAGAAAATLLALALSLSWGTLGPGGAAGATHSRVDKAASEADRVRGRILDVAQAGARLSAELRAAREAVAGPEGSRAFLGLGLLVAAMLLAGWAAECAFLALTRGPRRQLTEATEGRGGRVGRSLLMAAVDTLGVLIFGVAAAVVFLVVYPGPLLARALVLAILEVVLLLRLALVGIRLVLAPRAPDLRPLPFDDRTSRGLAAVMVALAAVAALTTGAIDFLELAGVSHDALAFLLTVFRLLDAGLVVAAIWAYREPVRVAMRGEAGTSPVGRALADLWPALATVYVVGVIVAAAVEVLADDELKTGAAVGSLLVGMGALMVDLALGHLLTLAAQRRRAAGGSAPYEPALRRVFHLMVATGSVLLLARLWGLDLFSLAEHGVGARWTQALVDIAVTLLLTYLVWAVATTALEQRLAQEGNAPRALEPGEEGGAGAASRLRTLSPVIRPFLLAVLVATATMIILSSLGVNIGPLLAGAGVAGIAIGFGTQALVRDIVSGAFFLADDAFRLGEYIEAGGIKGTVEKISIRSMQVRHHRGALHTLPYGQIERLTNHSRDWTVMKLEFRLTYETDLVLVKKILKRIGEELKQDPELGPHLIMPLKSQGVRATEDSAVVVRAKFVSEPGDWPYLIQREAYNRVLKAFRERGVTFAHQQVTVFAAPGGEAGPVAAPDLARAAGAAGAAASAPAVAPAPPATRRADDGLPTG